MRNMLTNELEYFFNPEKKITKKELIKKKEQLDNKLKAFDKTIAERNQIETAKREEQSAFLRQQNENLDKFLKSIDGGKS